MPPGALRSPAPLRVDLLDPAALPAAELGRWAELAERAGTPNPFFEAPFLVPAARLLAGERSRLLVARGAAGEWLGALPVRRTLRWRRVPALALASWHHAYSYLGAPLLVRGREIEALVRLLSRARRRAGLVTLEQLPGEATVEHVRVACEQLGVEPVVWSRSERAFLRRRPEPMEHLLLRSKRLRELRRQRNLLSRELGEPLVTRDLAGDGAAVERFLALESAGWKGEAGTSMAAARADAFFREICANFAAAGRLQLLSLAAGGRTVAMKCNLIAGDGVFCFKIAHDPALARSSPGVQLELDNVAHFGEHAELAWMDSCADPENQMINRIWPDRRTIHTMLVPGAGVIGRLSRAEAAAASSIRHRLKEHRS